MKLSEFVENTYWDYCKKLRKSTVVGYESAYRCHIEKAFGDSELEDITVEAIELWLASFEKSGAARKAYSVLRAMLRKAFKWNRTKFDPTVLQIDLPHQRRYVPEVLSDKEIYRFIKAIYGWELEAVLLCEITLGLRRCEACALTWNDIDLRSGTVDINKGRHYVAGEILTEQPKSDTSWRRLELPTFARDRLRELSKGHAKDEPLSDLSPDTIAQRYKAFCKRNDLKFVPMKNLRHSYATSLLRAGVPVKVVSMILGHTDSSTTERYYLVPDKNLIKAAQKTWATHIMKQSKLITFAAQLVSWVSLGNVTYKTCTGTCTISANAFSEVHAPAEIPEGYIFVGFTSVSVSSPANAVISSFGYSTVRKECNGNIRRITSGNDLDITTTFIMALLKVKQFSLTRVQYGNDTVTISAVNTNAFKQVTFNEPFSETPVITATPTGNNPSKFQVSITGRSTNGFTLYCRNTTNTDDATVSWVAVGKQFSLYPVDRNIVYSLSNEPKTQITTIWHADGALHLTRGDKTQWMVNLIQEQLSLSPLFYTRNITLPSLSIAAGAGSDLQSYTLPTISGYTPVGIMGKNTGAVTCYFSTDQVDSDSVQYRIRNTATGSTANITPTMRILYIKEIN